MRCERNPWAILGLLIVFLTTGNKAVYSLSRSLGEYDIFLLQAIGYCLKVKRGTREITEMGMPDYGSVMLPLLRFTEDRQEHSLWQTIDVLVNQFA